MRISPIFVSMKKNVFEGFRDEHTPDMKYYAFDWDDNIMTMPTQIILKNDSGKEVGMSTEDFAEFRHIIGKENFDYKGDIVVGFSDNPFRNFRVEGDNMFLSDVLKGKPGPAFPDFRDAINNGSIFSIITARGHNPQTIKKGIFKLILNNFNGIDKKLLIKNLRKYRTFADENELSDKELIDSYLELNRYYPVSFGDEQGAQNPEVAKVIAMDEFVSYIRGMAAILNKKAYIKNEVGNNFVPKMPTIGFSDDDEKNVSLMKKHFEDKEDNIVQTFSTSGGIKRKV